VAQGYTWVEDPAHGLPPPACVVGTSTRQNHLGSGATMAGRANTYNWTLPEVATTQRCTLRVRYNMSSTDVNDVPVVATAALNGNNSP
ncbi:hypothetical protein GUF51_25765, partial [Xanthomonas citri pv. citri]|nr:hypothetical protein [Xanthomonas citri pv. citri]